MSQLQIRLKNCIQTILDLEVGIKQNRLEIFDADFVRLKDFLKNIDQIQLVEEDVSRLENVTSHFLTEIGRKANWTGNYKILQ